MRKLIGAAMILCVATVAYATSWYPIYIESVSSSIRKIHYKCDPMPIGYGSFCYMQYQTYSYYKGWIDLAANWEQCPYINHHSW